MTAGPTLLVGHAHLDVAWVWTPREARIEALETTRAVIDLLGEHPTATFAMSQAAVWSWIAEDDPGVLRRLRDLVEADRVEPVGGWWVEPDLFGASPESIRRQGRLGQGTFERLIGRRCTVGFAPDTFGHPAWLPDVLLEAGLDTYVITRPAITEADLPAAFWWEGEGGARVRVVRPASYAGAPAPDPSGLSLYGVGNHGGGPTRAHLAEADRLCETGEARIGLMSSWEPRRDLPVVRGDLIHHARGCYATLASFKERMRSIERRLIQVGAPDDTWEPLLFWQFHDVLAGTSIPEVYDEADADLLALEHVLAPGGPGPTNAATFVPRHRVDEGRPVVAIETTGEPWHGWVATQWLAVGPAAGVDVVGAENAVLRRVEQHGTAWRLHVLLLLSLEPGEHRELRWDRITGQPPALPPAPPGVRMAVVEDGSDTWGHGMRAYGAEVSPGPATMLSLAGGPDGLVEAWGEWHEHDRALKLIVPSALPITDGEMPGGEWPGGRVWSYDVVESRSPQENALRLTIRRSPPYAQHDPIGREPGVEHRWTEQGPFAFRYWLSPQPTRVPPMITVR